MDISESEESDRTSEVYVLGRTSEEYQRLKRQAKEWEKATTMILEEAGLREGMTCLDVGCGPGEVMRLMGERVGRKGKVVGFDNDGKIGREALEVLKSIGSSNFEFIEGNVEQLDKVIKGSYDVVYARFLLFHLMDPISVLTKMYEMTKPEGCIVVQDYDLRTADEYPPSESAKEMRRVFFAVCEKVGRDVNIGSKLPSLFVQAGIGRPDGTRVDCLLTPSSPRVLAVYRSSLPLALKFGLTTEEAGKAVIEKWNLEQHDESRYSLSSLCIGAWKRKPV